MNNKISMHKLEMCIERQEAKAEKYGNAFGDVDLLDALRELYEYNLDNSYPVTELKEIYVIAECPKGFYIQNLQVCSVDYYFNEEPCIYVYSDGGEKSLPLSQINETWFKNLSKAEAALKEKK